MMTLISNYTKHPILLVIPVHLATITNYLSIYTALDALCNACAYLLCSVRVIVHLHSTYTHARTNGGLFIGPLCGCAVSCAKPCASRYSNGVKAMGLVQWRMAVARALAHPASN